MRALPILCTDWSVRRILAGAKAQARRPMKVQPSSEQNQWVKRTADGRWWVMRAQSACVMESEHYIAEVFPRYAVGDQLWVKEAWRIACWDIDFWRLGIEYRDGTIRECESQRDENWTERVWCQCDDDMRNGRLPTRWRLGMFMPRAFSRILREVTGVRAERVQSISYDDVLAEGVTAAEIVTAHKTMPDTPASVSYDDELLMAARLAFKAVWDPIYGPKSPYRWGLNPWNFAYNFKVLEPAP